MGEEDLTSSSRESQATREKKDMTEDKREGESADRVTSQGKSAKG